MERCGCLAIWMGEAVERSAALGTLAGLARRVARPAHQHGTGRRKQCVPHPSDAGKHSGQDSGAGSGEAAPEVTCVLA